MTDIREIILLLRTRLIMLIAGDCAVLMNIHFHRVEFDASGKTLLLHNVVFETEPSK